ncbi:MAG: hypothetical protein ACK5VI_10325 [Opitutia bacterium]
MRPRPMVALLAALACLGAAPEEPEVEAPGIELADDGAAADGTGGAATVGTNFKSTLVAEGYRFNEKVQRAYVADQRARAMDELAKMGKPLPADFLAWVDGDPEVEATVYGSARPSHVLLMLRTLAIDVGEPRFRRYKSWLLAAAVKNANRGPEADIRPRPPLRLAVPPDPRKPVDTRDPKRIPDVNDAIINFLEDNRIVASDVMYEAEWQAKFNAAMAEKGFPVRVDCSMKLGPGTDREKRARLSKVMDAYRILQAAYEAKGRIPREKDPRIGLAEWVVFQVDNHEAGRSKSRFPLDKAPWPVLTALLNPRLSLREAHHINAPNSGIIPGNRRTLNAFSTNMLKAVDVRPFPFAEGSWFMVKKHGGACGTRAMLASNQNKAQGLPSIAVSEIGHASWAEIAYFEKGDRFKMRFEGGGHDPDQLGIQLALPISRGRNMEKASNWIDFLEAVQRPGSVTGYMRSMMAHHTLQSLTPAERAEHGATLKADALALNPGNILLNGDLAENAAAAQQERKKARQDRR